MSSLPNIARRTLLVALLAAGCTGRAHDDRVRFDDAVAAPPEIADAMWELRAASHRLDAQVLERGSWWRAPDADEVAATLGEIRRIAEPLADDPVARQDPRIARNLPRFLAIVDRAERDVSSTSPRFDWVDELASGCELCHDRVP